MNRASLIAPFSLALAGMLAGATAHAQTLTITSPAAGQRLAAGPDYATDVLGDAWDMSNAEDISVFTADRAGWASDFGFANGRVGGTTVAVSGAADTSLMFLYRGYYDTINTARSGRRFPIDTTLYKKLAFKINSGVNQFPQVYWFHQAYGDPATGGVTDNGDGVTQLVETGTGWKIYEVDLTQVSIGGEAWAAAPVLGLRIDPNSTVVGHQVFFDWVRLTRADSDPEASTHTVQWSGGTGSTTIEVIDSAGTSLTIASGLSAATTQYAWKYGGLPPGNYTLRITSGGSIATGAFSINNPPVVQVTNPDETGGTDFATAVLSNAWDMADTADVEFSANLASTSFSGGQFHATSTSNDPQVWTLYGFANARPIDTTRYRYLTFQLQVDGDFDLGLGSVARVFYGSTQGRPDLMTTTKDIIVWPGMNTYAMDLGSLTFATDGGLVAGTTQQLWSANSVVHLRIDPHEFEAARTFHVADVKLAAIDETSGGGFTITFSGSDADAGDSPTVALYYDTDTSATNGRTLIASGISAGSASYTWNTTSVPAGTYYIYAETTDGLDTRGMYSTGPVQIIGGGSTTATLTVAVNGNGSVSSSPAGIACGVDCTEAYAFNTSVTLIATPGGTSVFSGWSGDAACASGVVTMSADRSCTANFIAALGTGPTLGSIDLNGDSGADSFRYNASTGAWAMDFGNRAGAFYTKTGTWSAGWTVTAGDFDGNGLTDFFLYNATIGQWSKAVNNNAADFTLFTSTWSPGWTPHVIDLNGDGMSDVFLYNISTGVWFKCISTGSGTGEFSYTSGVWSADWELHPVDLNGDGKTDFFLYNRTNGQWFRATNDGGAGFTYASGFWSAGWSIYPGDYNGDALSDLFLYDVTSGQWFVVMNTGTGFSYTNGAWSGGWTIRTGDFATDGRTDLFLYSTSTGQWYEAISDGSGGFSYSGGSWSGGWQVYVTDFDVDRSADILLYSPDTGTYFQAINTDGGTFQYNTGNWGTGWTIVATRTSVP